MINFEQDEEETRLIGHYKIIQPLGEGHFGKVKLAQDIETNEYVAIKIFKKKLFADKPDQYRKLQREIALMSLLDHPHTLRLIETLESTQHLHLVIEYAANGELFDLLVQRGSLPEGEAMNYFREIIYTIDFLHRHGICHRDLKPENILLDDCNHIKIADFGFAKWLKDDIAITMCGTPYYVAPEVMKGTPYNGKAVDIWSLGVILYAMIAGCLPFDDPDVRVLISKIKKCEYQMPDSFSPELKDLISKMINLDPNQRLSTEQIIQHPAFSINLPYGYIFPSPIPLPKLFDPVDPSKVDEKVFKTLKQIGYASDEELNHDLSSNENTMAKVFYFMLTHSLKLEDLPWDQSNQNQISAYYSLSSNDSEISLNLSIGSDQGSPNKSNNNDHGEIKETINVTTSDYPTEQLHAEKNNHDDGSIAIDPFHRRRKPHIVKSDKLKMTKSLSIYSLANKADWTINEKDTLIYDQDANIPDIKLSPSEIMCMIQRLVLELSCRWFYPDDLRLIAKTDAGIYITFDAAIQDVDMITLFVHMNHGTTEQFQMLMNRIHEELNLI